MAKSNFRVDSLMKEILPKIYLSVKNFTLFNLEYLEQLPLYQVLYPPSSPALKFQWKPHWTQYIALFSSACWCHKPKKCNILFPFKLSIISYVHHFPIHGSCQPNTTCIHNLFDVKYINICIQLPTKLRKLSNNNDFSIDSKIFIPNEPSIAFSEISSVIC